jgi:ribonuclease J
LKQNEHKIKALFITHGHEDHIGAVKYLINEVKIDKVYSGKLAAELIKRRLIEEKILNKTTIIEIDDDFVYQSKHFKIDFFRVHHSIPDSFGMALQTVNGNIVNTGDYRFDFTPLGDHCDISKITDVGKRGVDLLLCDSTNSEKSGFSESERGILVNIKDILSKTKGRVFISSFASNIGRIEEIVSIAVNQGRKICPLGRSMVNNIDICRRIGYLQVPETSIIEARDADKYKDEEILVVCTGSQGEERAALNTMAKGKHA